MFQVIRVTIMGRPKDTLYEDGNFEACKLVADSYAHSTYKIVVVNSGGIGLDGLNQGAILLLIRHAFRNPTTVRDIMTQALCKNSDKSKEI